MRRALIGSALLFSVACLANDDLTGSGTVNGSYVLHDINGSQLPFAISGSGTNRVDMLDDVINFYEGGTFAENGHKRTVVNGQATDTPIIESGTYQLLGTSVTMKSSDGSHERRPQINGNTMTFVEAGITMTFHK